MKKISYIWLRFVTLLSSLFKQSDQVLDKDVILVKIIQKEANNITPGVKVITDRGVANIVKIRDNWLVLSLRDKEKLERKYTNVYQYFAVWTDHFNHTLVCRPLAYADYNHIDPTIDSTIARVTITKKKYAKLIDEEKDTYLEHFNSVKGGPQVLEKLRKGGFKIIQEDNLITIKKQ
jgi:hypothetical protein